MILPNNSLVLLRNAYRSSKTIRVILSVEDGVLTVTRQAGMEVLLKKNINTPEVTIDELNEHLWDSVNPHTYSYRDESWRFKSVLYENYETNKLEEKLKKQLRTVERFSVEEYEIEKELQKIKDEYDTRAEFWKWYGVEINNTAILRIGAAFTDQVWDVKLTLDGDVGELRSVLGHNFYYRFEFSDYTITFDELQGVLSLQKDYRWRKWKVIDILESREKNFDLAAYKHQQEEKKREKEWVAKEERKSELLAMKRYNRQELAESENRREMVTGFCGMVGGVPY